MYIQSWAHLFRDTFVTLLFVKVSEHCITSKNRDESIGASSTCFLQIVAVIIADNIADNIRHKILFHVLYNGTVIINRKQVDDAPILSSRYVEVTQCSDTFTKSNGAKVSRYKCAQLCVYLLL